jgi:hypothetical protein
MDDMESVVKSWAKCVFRWFTEPVSTTRGNLLRVAYMVAVLLVFSDDSGISHYR